MAGVPLEEVGARAAELFGSGFNCAESVLKANMEHLGVEGAWFPRVATGFGSGIAQAGQVCGVVSGAVITGGWLLGRDEPSDSRDELRRLLSELPPRERAVIVLRYYCDQSEQETAATLGMPLGTVKSTCSRALARLRVEVSAGTGGAT